MPPVMEVGLGPGDFVFDWDPAPPERRAQPHPIFGPCLLYCGQTAGWMETPLCTEVHGDIVLDGDQALRERDTTAPSFRPMSIVATVAHLSYCCRLCRGLYLRTKWHLDPSSRLATTDMGKIEGLCLFWGKDPHLTQCGQARGLPHCQVSF